MWKSRRPTPLRYTRWIKIVSKQQILIIIVRTQLPQRRDFDDPDHQPAEAIEGGGDEKALIAGSRALGLVADESGKVLAARPDGLVREVIGKQVISREEVNELTETEERKALGDFSDEVSLTILGLKNFTIISVQYYVFKIFPY